MGALLTQFAVAGVTLTALPDGRLHAAGPLTDTLRTAIRAHKLAILAEMAAANDATPATATPAQAAELRALVARVAASWPEAERAEALADPADALTSWRALAADMEPAPTARQYPAGPYTSAPLSERDPADDRRTCRDCAHLSLIGRCTAARGNPNTDAGRSGFPIDDLLRRCLAYAPGPADPDRRTGAERWPGMVEDARRRQEAATEARNG